MHAIHNAWITLLATALSNLALGVIVAGFIAPAVSGQLHGGWQVVPALAGVAFEIALHSSAQVILEALR